MAREKTHDSASTKLPEPKPTKKAYKKPRLQCLGSVSELTQMGNPYGR